MKFNVVSKDTEPHEPPSKSLGSIDLEQVSVVNEAELVQRIFSRYGTGSYLVQTNVGPRNKFQNIWEGEIQVESSQTLLFKADLNVLPDLTEVSSSEGPRTGKLKRVSVPDSGLEKARRIVATQAE